MFQTKVRAHVAKGKHHGADRARLLSPPQATRLPAANRARVIVTPCPLERGVTVPTSEPGKGILRGNGVSADGMS